MSTVRLTLQLWDSSEGVRLTRHCTLPVKQVRNQAEELLKSMLLTFPQHETKPSNDAKRAAVAAQSGLLSCRNSRQNKQRLQRKVTQQRKAERKAKARR
jgi:GTP cyclohydrolase FolE2